MNKLKSVAVIIALTCIIFIPEISVAQETEVVPYQNGPSAGKVVLDLLLVRPFCVVGSLTSTAVCIVTMPAAFLVGVGDQSAHLLVQAPWRFTTGRPLGEFNTYRDGYPIGHVER